MFDVDIVSVAYKTNCKFLHSYYLVEFVATQHDTKIKLKAVCEKVGGLVAFYDYNDALLEDETVFMNSAHRILFDRYFENAILCWERMIIRRMAEMMPEHLTRHADMTLFVVTETGVCGEA